MNRPAKPTAPPPSSDGETAASAPAGARVIEIEDPMIGKQLAHFVINARVAQGEHGTVYLAEDASLKQRVALKLLRRPLDADAAFCADLIASARLQANISHQNVAKVRYVGEDQGRPYIVSEYVAGQSLKRALAQGGAMAWEDAVAVMVEIVRALQAAQTAGVFHGALTSSNVIVQYDETTPDGPPSVKLVDFGAGRANDEHPYAAPEHVAGEPANMREDMYALGVIFHEMLTAVPPQPGRSLPEGAAPPYIRRLVAFLARPEPRQRPSGYDELLTRLEVALVKPVAAVPRLSRAAAFGIDLLALCLVALAVGLGITMTGFGTRWEGYQVGFGMFAAYSIAAHTVNRQTLGKRLCDVRLQRARGLLTWGRMATRFAVEFWGPIAAMVLIDVELGSNPTWQQITSRLGSTIAIIGALWAASFVVVLTDRKGLALHDHATDTSVVAV
jgi:uncharacterized RDD family membrane protein YckC/tRNA A-37 threonylcarbamoyl transferase component Bud32